MTELSKEILQAEFKHVKDITYLDHAGATLYSSKQLQDHMTDLTSHLYSNPHSGSLSSNLTCALIDSAREMVLQHFHTDSDHYDVVFTAGCTAALDLLCQAFPWEERSLFCYLDDNHTSVVGMREVARRNGAKTVCLSADDVKITSSEASYEPHPPTPSLPEPHPPPSNDCTTLSEPHPPLPCSPHHLFAYPAQSNFSGYKYPLSWCQDIPNGRLVLSSCGDVGGAWTILLDAASLVSTSPLNLTACSPHFVTLSFYKLFGFPTGLGALLVRRDCVGMLTKHYYGGGTVKATDSWSSFHVLKEQLHDRFEDGTLPFLDILALRHGFATLTRLGRSMQDIQKHTFGLARLVYSCMSELRHRNGAKACHIYSQTDYSGVSEQGPIVNFNMLKPDGQVLGYGQVEKLASVFDIHLRTGCFCNTGACMKFLGLDSAALKSHLQHGHECGDNVDLIEGRPTGSVRISFGYMSTREDAKKLLSFIKKCFIDESLKPDLIMPIYTGSVAGLGGRERCGSEGCGVLTQSTSLISCGDAVHVVSELGRETPSLSSPSPSPTCVSPPSASLSLHSITLYPVKSCAGFRVQQWLVGGKGLLFDREWMIVSESGSLLSLKQEPGLCLIQPSISLERWELTLAAEGHDSVVIPAVLTPDTPQTHLPLSMRVCGDRVQGIDCGAAAAKWLTGVLGKKCQLVRQNPQHNRRSRGSQSQGIPSLSLANEAQYLMLSESSLEQLLVAISPDSAGLDIYDLALRFRANFVVSDGEMEPYGEEKWKEIGIGNHTFQVTGKCVRCQVVCVDPSSGGRSIEPLRTLLALRGSKASFGVYLGNKFTLH